MLILQHKFLRDSDAGTLSVPPAYLYVRGLPDGRQRGRCRLTELRTKTILIWGKIWDFGGCFQKRIWVFGGILIDYWAKNGGWYVNLRGLGKIGKENMVKMSKKSRKMMQNEWRLRENHARFEGKFGKIWKNATVLDARGRRQRTEDGGRRTEDGRRKTGDGGRRSEDRSQSLGLLTEKSEDGSQKTEDGRQWISWLVN